MTQRSSSFLALENVYHWEKTVPDRVYLTQPMGNGVIRDFTWKQTMDEVRRMAAYLISLQYPKGSRIAILAKNQAHWIMADLAIWMAGHVTVPLYPTLVSTTVHQILEHSEAQLIFIGKLDTWEDMKDGIAQNIKRVYLPLAPKENDGEKWDKIISSTDPYTESPSREADDLATIVYTSGSTGIPKGVMHSFRTMGVSAVGVVENMDVTDQDRMISYLPLAHVFERWIVEMSSIVSGFHVFFAESLDTFVQDVQRARPTIFISVPRLWVKFQSGVFAKMPPKELNFLLKIPFVSSLIKKKILTGLGLDQVRFAGSGSAPLSPEVIKWYQSLGLELLEGYGMSENFCYSHISRVGKSKPGYVGQVYPEVECRISQEGEIQIKSPGTMVGYYKASELTKEVITEDGFLKTGDRGEIDDQGRLRIAGRVKELFKTSKGKYVAPAPIENLLMAHERIEQVCVSGDGQAQPFALIVLDEQTRKKLSSGELSKNQVTQELEAAVCDINPKLDPHEQLEIVVVVKEPWLIENGMLTPTMKIKRGEVEGKYKEFVSGWYKQKQKVIWE